MQTQKKDALLVTQAPLDDALAARLMEIILQDPARAIALSTRKEFTEVDTLLHQQVIQPLAALFNKEYPSAPILSKDHGYVLSECQAGYREDHHPFHAFANRVERSTDQVAMLVYLQTGSAKIHFESLNVSVPERKGLAIIFPSSWWYKPILIAEGSSFIVTTFLTHV